MAEIADAGAVPGRTERSRFFARAALAMLACVMLAFPLTYFWPVLSGAEHFRALRHVHGAAFFAWFGLYAWQSRLISNGLVARHREVGMYLFALSGALLPLGMWMALTAAGERAAKGDSTPFAFTVYNCVDIGFFTAFIVAAIATAMRRTDWHKRFMFAAAISLVGPAISRWFYLIPAAPPWTDMAPNLLADLFYVALAVHDRRTLGRIHPVTWIAAILTVPVHFAEPWIAASAGWNALAQALFAGF